VQAYERVDAKGAMDEQLQAFLSGTHP